MTDLNLKSFDPLYPMRIHQYNELLNDSNVDIMDKVNAVIDYLNQVGKLTNDVVKDWNVVYQWVMNDGLTQDVSNKLEQMLANHEFDSLISTIVAMVGDLTTLTTSQKDTVVNAINSLKTDLTTSIGLKADQTALTATNNLIGDLTTLQTVDKDSVVHAINDNVVSLGQKASQTDLNKTNTTISSMHDPLAYLNTVKVLTKFSARGQTTDAWIQGFSINEATNEIYVAVQRNDGTTGIIIEVRNLDGTFKESKTVGPIDNGAFTENLPFFYNASNQLCFIVHTQNAYTYSIYNYSLNSLGSPIAISGSKFKGNVDGNYYVTCDTTSSTPYTMKTIYVYDWISIQNGSPTLLNTLRVPNYGATLTEKIQGVVVNNGYFFFPQGASGGNPALSVYNTNGQLVNAFLYTKESVATAINTYYPNEIIDITNYSYENESGCKYKGKLVTSQIINSMVYLFVHNSPDGVALEMKVPAIQNDTGWLTNITLLNGATVYGSDTTPRIRRIGNIVMLDGALNGISVLNQNFMQIDSSLAPDRNFQFTQVTSNGKQCNWQVQPDGTVKIINSENTPLSTTDWYPFHAMWFI